jgi:hypothetical protein
MRPRTQRWTARVMKALVIAILFGRINAYAQLHVITGTTTRKSDESFAVDLLKVSSEGKLEEVEQLASPKEGLWWIETADDSRTLVIMTRHTKDAIVVVDMKQGKVVKRCEEWPDVPGYVSHEIWPTQEWLLADVTGQQFVGRYGSRGDPDAVLQGMSLEPAVPCAESFRMLGPTDVARVYVQGAGGITGLTSVDPMTLLVDAEGRVRTRIGGDFIYLGYSVPREYWGDMKVPLAAVLASNSRVLIMYYWDADNAARTRTIAYDKVKKTWSSVPLPGIPLVRTFGSILAMPERVERTAATFKEGSDKSNLRKATSINGPSTRFSFEEEERQGRSYSGRLHIYDVATGKSSLLMTNEEDSEVLWADADTIYYRVNDKLYSSKAGISGITPGRLIATDDRIRDAHWAFMK